MEKKGLGLLIMLLIVLASENGITEVEAKKGHAKKCEVKSRGFKGICFSNPKCALACKNEGYYDGTCHGFLRRCFCTKRC